MILMLLQNPLLEQEPARPRKELALPCTSRGVGTTATTSILLSQCATEEDPWEPGEETHQCCSMVKSKERKELKASWTTLEGDL
jgi:hypothetical protein